MCSQKWTLAMEEILVQVNNKNTNDDNIDILINIDIVNFMY